MFRTVCSRTAHASGPTACATGCRLKGQHASRFQRFQRSLERMTRISCGSVQPHRLYGFPDSEKGGEFSVVGGRWSVVGGCSCLPAPLPSRLDGVKSAVQSRQEIRDRLGWNLALLEPCPNGTSRSQYKPQTDRSLSDSDSARNSRYEACTPDSREICGSQPVSRIRVMSHSFRGVPSGLLVSCRISP